jgi:hypothetical protein
MAEIGTILTAGEKVISWLLKRKARRTAEIDSYIKQIQEACNELIEMNDPTSDKASFIHEQLKVLYDMALVRLPENFIEAHGGNLFRALSSARIYYWLRIAEEKSRSELQQLFDDRKNMPMSLEALSKILYDASGTDNLVNITALDIDHVKRLCLNDIARLTIIEPFP